MPVYKNAIKCQNKTTKCHRNESAKTCTNATKCHKIPNIAKKKIKKCHKMPQIATKLHKTLQIPQMPRSHIIKYQKMSPIATKCHKFLNSHNATN